MVGYGQWTSSCRIKTTHQVVVFGSVLFEQRVGGEVGGVTSGGEDDRAVLGVLLAILLVLDSDSLVTVLEDLGDLGLLEDLDTVWGTLGEILQLTVSTVQGGSTRLGPKSAEGAARRRLGVFAERDHLPFP